MDSSVENVENYTKEVSKMCKTPHFSHFKKRLGYVYQNDYSRIGAMERAQRPQAIDDAGSSTSRQDIGAEEIWKRQL